MELDRILELKDKTYDDKKFKIFKMFFEENNDSEFLDFDNLIDMEVYDKLKKSGDSELLKIFLNAMIMKEINVEFINSRKDDFGITDYFYSDILDKMKMLSLELGLSNSLELSNLYTYLLWNGYLSKNKENIYMIENRKSIRGLYFADIMDGIGVCLNYSDMLSDFLNACGYNSVIINNLFDKKTTFNYKLEIDRKVKKSSVSRRMLNFMVTPIIKKFGNHAFSLVVDNNKMYIYDPTNLMLLEVVNPFTAKVINGNGTFLLHPYFSFMYAVDEDKKQAIYKLFESEDFSSPYNRKDLIFTGEERLKKSN